MRKIDYKLLAIYGTVGVLFVVVDILGNMQFKLVPLLLGWLIAEASKR